MFKTFFLRRKLRKRQEEVIFEIQMDIKYIKEFKEDDLNYDEEMARDHMKDLKKKESRTPEEDADLAKLQNNIAQAVAVKTELQNKYDALFELNNYITLLK